MFDFVKDSYYELQKVNWPSKDQTIRLTRYVIGVSLAVGVYVAVLDAVFNFGLKNLIVG